MNVNNERIWLIGSFIAPESFIFIAVLNFTAGINEMIAGIHIAQIAEIGISTMQMKNKTTIRKIAKNLSSRQTSLSVGI